MSYLPSLLTIDSLAEHLNNRYCRKISEETLIEYGLDRILNFVVVNAKRTGTKLTLINCKSKPSLLRVKLVQKSLFDTLLENNRSIFFEYVTEINSFVTNAPPITSQQLGFIIQNDLVCSSAKDNTHFLLTVVYRTDQFNVCLQYLAVPKNFYSMKDLRITRDEVMRFEKKIFSKNRIDNEPSVNWTDLFVNPPQKHSDGFEDIKEAVIHFIDDNNSLPEYKDIVISLGLTTKISKDNLRKCWNRYTRL